VYYNVKNISLAGEDANITVLDPTQANALLEVPP